MEVDTVASYSSYQPHGETLTLALDSDDVSPESLFAHALTVHHCLARLMHPRGFAIWLTCAIDGTSITVTETEPSQPYWHVREQNYPTTVTHEIPTGLNFTVRVVQDLSDDALKEVFREATHTTTCDDDLVTTFEQLVPTGVLTRIFDKDEVRSDGTVAVTIYDQELTHSTISVNDTVWLDTPPPGSTYLPPITYTVNLDGYLFANISVHWSRWLDRGTEEHRSLTAALRSMIKLGWQLRGESHVFDLGLAASD
jgi:hypothetical protein